MNPTPDGQAAPPFAADWLHNGDVEILYGSDRITVGNGSIRVGRRRYPINQMRRLRIVRVRYRRLGVSATAVVYVGVAVWGRVSDVLGFNPLLAAAAAVAVPFLLAVFGTRRERRRQLVADFHALPTLVIRDKDPRQFERVVHAILAERQARNL